MFDKSVKRLEKIDLKCEIDEDLKNLLEGAKKTLKCFIIKGGKWLVNGIINMSHFRIDATS
jgi:hypothetical protein